MNEHRDYLIDQFVSTQPGEPYRLFPFGRLVKGGRVREITPELASQFKLPHFRPPIKLGSHEETTPAGGHIVGLEVRKDGLYAVPEMTEKGARSMAEGDYRYHSPEVIWEGGGLEDPQTGEIIAGPLIVGDALLHTPHLGEAAALYSVEPVQEKTMTEETVQVPKTIFETFTAWLRKRTAEPEPATLEVTELRTAPATEPPDVPEEFKTALVERDQLKAQLASLQAERAQAERLTAIQADLNTQEFGAAYFELAKAEEAAAMLAGMDEDQRAWVLRNFRALSVQIEESAITGEIGSSAPNTLPDNPVAALDAVVSAKAAEMKIGYNAALQAVLKEQPELVANAYGKKEK